ncbi:MAG: hypothetical protein IT178_05470 [Acidobacteria bacterium]|nr:hypothetical protein [Acidobacteriota bacterium]
MQKLFTMAAALALVATIACGKSEAEKQAERAAAELEKAAEAATRAGEAAAKAGETAGQEAAKGMEDFAKAMAGFAGAMAGGDGKTVDPVSFQALQQNLPSVSGWEMDKPRGERMTSPVPFSQTEARYSNGNSRIEVKIVDSGFAPLLTAPWAMMLATGYSRESTEGYEKAVTVGGQPAFEKWDSEGKDGELNILVNKRFLVTVEGDDIADTKVLHEVAGKMDFGKIATLK